MLLSRGTYNTKLLHLWSQEKISPCAVPPVTRTGAVVLPCRPHKGLQLQTRSLVHDVRMERRAADSSHLRLLRSDIR